MRQFYDLNMSFPPICCNSLYMQLNYEEQIAL